MIALRPASALFWVYLAMLPIGAFALLLQLAPTLSLTLRDVLLGMPFTLATLLVFGWLIVRLDPLRAHRRIRVPLIMGLLWGGMVGPAVALWANDHNMEAIQNLAGDAFAIGWQAPISAAIVEEGIKGLGVFTVAWLARPLLNRPIHGLLLGGCTGLGFQVVEDITYSANAGLSSAQDSARDILTVGLLRFVVGITSHWMFTALAGIGIVVALARRDWSPPRRFLFFAAFYLLGATLHFVWDAPSPDDINGTVLLLGKMVLYIAIFATVYGWVVRTEHRWFRRAAESIAAQGIAPPEELATLLTHRTRRRARTAIRRLNGPPRRILLRRQHKLIDMVQTLG
ncbi:PrsW family intramembrane metalloprotease [Nocardia uniformis]|uniref:PrsW family intramembrane metalloprotease n=1 Tax=Nocardia uniformis TaxID=53432 RepID=A0A849CBE3_9NOCA|nr:PrsW family intramembrane metalloprotease [Nocardia uniformis]NNH72239.1 PrsW family intramembrane metalloprotease [Nocardia uniformis]